MKLIAVIFLTWTIFLDPSSSHVIIHPYIARIPQAHHIVQFTAPVYYQVDVPEFIKTNKEKQPEGNVSSTSDNKQPSGDYPPPPPPPNGNNERKMEISPPGGYIITGPDGVAIAALRPFPGILPAYYPIDVQYGIVTESTQPEMTSDMEKPEIKMEEEENPRDKVEENGNGSEN